MNNTHSLHFGLREVKSVLGLILSLLTFCSYSQNSESTSEIVISSLNEAWEMALSNNPNYQVYLLNQDKTNFDYKANKAFRFPTISGSFNSQKNIDLATTPVPGEIFGQPGQTIDAQFGSKYNYNTGITISKNLLDWQSTLKLKIARNGMNKAKMQTDIYVQDMKNLIASNYYAILILEKAILLNKKNLKNAEQIFLVSTNKFDQGLIDQQTHNKADINKTNIQQDLIQNSIHLAKYKSELKKILGLSTIQSIAVSGEISENLTIHGELLENKSLMLSDLEIEESKLYSRFQQANYLPKLNLTNYIGKQQFRNDNGFSFVNGNWSDYSYLSVNLSIPIFSGFSNQNKLKANKVEQSISKKKYEANVLASDLQDKMVLEQLNLSRSSTDKTIKNLELYKQNHDLSLQKYSEGLLSLDAYLKTFDDYIKAENAYLNAVSNQYSYYTTIISRVK